MYTRSALSVMLALPALLLASPAWPAFTLEELMRTLAQRGPENARFVEKKYLAVLDNKPIESSGELRYVPPNRIEKKTVKPKPESLTVDGDQAVVERGGQRHTLKLRDYPDIAPFVDSIRGTLAGDRKALERNYRLSLEGGPQDWVLQLVPIERTMQAVLKHIRIAGAQDQLKTVEITQSDGDSSLMVIEKSTAAP